MFKAIKNFWRELKQTVSQAREENRYKCRVVAIEQEADESYIIKIQLVNKSQVLAMKPEEILADDDLTNCFSPLDVRALTYLGYLSLNNPTYKILAQRLSEADNRMVFALREKGKTEPVIKTADEISTDPEMLAALDQHDAHMVGYTAASEQEAQHKAQLKKLLQQQKESNAS